MTVSNEMIQGAKVEILMEADMFTNTKGSAYIFVLIIMMTVFMMLTISLNVTGYETEITSVYNDYTNLYPLSVSGAEKVNAILNHELEKNYIEISKRALKKMKDNHFSNLADVVNYKLTALDDPCGGEFHLKSSGESYEEHMDALYGPYFAQAADEYILSSLANILTKEDGVYYFDYTVTVQEAYQSVDYCVRVQLKVNGTKMPTQYYVTATTTRPDTKAVHEVSAVISLSVPDHEEIFKPVYQWGDALSWVGYGAVAWGDVIFDETVLNPYSLSDTMEPFTLARPIADLGLTENIRWTLDNPIVFILDGGGNIDISDFYEGGEPIYTAIVNCSDAPLTIQALDPDRNHFRGVVFSKGDLVLTNVEVRGSLLSEQNITLLNSTSEPVQITPDPDALLAIRLADPALQRKMLDFFQATCFHGALSAETKTASAVGSLLGALVFADTGQLVIKNETGKAGYVIAKLN